MTTSNLNVIINKIDSFPTLPSIVAQVLRVVAKPNSSAGELAEVITPDPAMTMSILKIANSAFLGLPKRVVTLQHAIAIMGFDEIRNLVLAKAICQSFKSLKKHAKFDIRQFWSHSFLCGLAAKVIAAQSEKLDTEFFVAGLVHDIGKLVIYMAFPEEYCQMAADHIAGGPQLIAAEKANFSLSHDEVGFQLARRWFLPPNLSAAIGFHHKPHATEKMPDFAIVAHLADLLARIVAAKEASKAPDEYMKLIMGPAILDLARSCQLELSAAILDKMEKDLVASKKENSGILQMLLN